MGTAILELILVGAKIFSDERKRHYENKAKNLMKKITDVEDSEFYKKDMEAKGRAERDLIMEIDELKKQFLLEAAK
jgi:cell fate (sporulation/competence/biofilm development) regulator YmcA (YheA/YmcA/DUF963 family)